MIFFILVNGFASNCIKCHSSHYEEIADCTTCHRGIDSTSRKNIAHFNLITGKFADFLFNSKDISDAKRIIEDAGCRRCHLIAEKGNHLARDLYFTGKNREGEYISKMIKEPNEYMPNFNFDNATVVKIAKFIIFDGTVRRESKISPYPVYLDSEEKNIFSEKCGRCHKALLKGIGPAGKGDIGPNLSGIFTDYYKPFTFEKDRKFDENLLKKWLKNPRSINKNTTMPIINLSDSELKDLIKNLK